MRRLAEEEVIEAREWNMAFARIGGAAPMQPADKRKPPSLRNRREGGNVEPGRSGSPSGGHSMPVIPGQSCVRRCRRRCQSTLVLSNNANCIVNSTDGVTNVANQRHSTAATSVGESIQHIGNGRVIDNIGIVDQRISRPNQHLRPRQYRPTGSSQDNRPIHPSVRAKDDQLWPRPATPPWRHLRLVHPTRRSSPFRPVRRNQGIRCRPSDISHLIRRLRDVAHAGVRNRVCLRMHIHTRVIQHSRPLSSEPGS